MEEHQELRHSCKFCKKRFSCGRALGGHMRSHVTINTAEPEEKLHKKKVVNGGDSTNNYVGLEESANSGYDLRENPKKTWRLSDPGDSSVFGQVNRVCKDCGKGFMSLKALFGHMRCHSERFSRSLEDDSWSEEQHRPQPILDSHSDNEGAPKKTRSRRTTATRYGIGTSSFSVSDEQQEQEEQEQVAICLMMLSRDVGFGGGGIGRAIVVAESSDNNSVEVEVRSGLDKGLINVKQKPLNGASDHGSVFRKHKFDVSDNGLLRIGVNKLQNDVYEDGFHRDELKKSQFDVSDTEFQKGYGVSHAEFVVDESGFEISDTEVGEDSLRKTRIDSSNVELSRSSRRKTRIDSSDAELERHSIKKTRFDCSETELGKDSYKKTGFDGFDSESRKKNRHDVSCSDLRVKRSKFDALDAELGKEHYKRSRYECTTCNKIFHSYQALGGHRASHKKVKGCFARIETSENSIETDSSPDHRTSMGEKIKSCKIENLIERGGINTETNCRFKKIKIHECPVCLRVFSSGQALGGHKRSHMAPVGNSEIKDGACSTIVIQQKMPEISDLLDLNLPAPIDEEVQSHVGFKSWWVGNNQRHEQLGDDSETQFVADKSLITSENNLVSSKHTEFHGLATPPRPCLKV